MPDFHTVKKNETLGRIAENNHISFDELMRLNPQFRKGSADGKKDETTEKSKQKLNLTDRDADFIQVGEKIRIHETKAQTPTGKGAGAAPAKAAPQNGTKHPAKPAKTTPDKSVVADSAQSKTQGAGAPATPPNGPNPKSQAPSTAETVADTAASLLIPGYDLVKAIRDPNATAFDYAWGVVTAVPLFKVATGVMKGAKLIYNAGKVAKAVNTASKAVLAEEVAVNAAARFKDLAKVAGKAGEVEEKARHTASAAGAAANAKKLGVAANEAKATAEAAKAAQVARAAAVTKDLKTAGKVAVYTTGAELAGVAVQKTIGGAQAATTDASAPLKAEDIALDKTLQAVAGSRASNLAATHYIVGFQAQLTGGSSPIRILYATLVPKKDFHNLNLKDPNAVWELMNHSTQFISVNRALKDVDIKKYPQLAKFSKMGQSTVMTWNPQKKDWEMGQGFTPKAIMGGTGFVNVRTDLPNEAKNHTIASANYGVFWPVPGGKSLTKFVGQMTGKVANKLDDAIIKLGFGKHHPHSLKEELAEKSIEKAAKLGLDKLFENVTPVIGVVNRVESDKDEKGEFELKFGGSNMTDWFSPEAPKQIPIAATK